ncbi:Maf family protein [Paenibacillus herberti]|uniref:dTTP/UTP pyrophosphatase n=1 Tax=Paenibacillus herberti TaxID=1619309 RepID=A0A229P5U0_9BACL|nr:Maf family protein [Paenibacillus herberti]OXM17411.1 MAF protein [Paenibacillus herberti]
MNVDQLPNCLVLASSSPRRRELVGALRLPIPIEVLATDTDETVCPELNPRMIVAELSLRKAVAAAQQLSRESHPSHGTLVLGGDTIVVLDGEVLGKPLDAEDARQTLRRLSGRAHEVYSGVSLLFVPESDQGVQEQLAQLATPAFSAGDGTEVPAGLLDIADKSARLLDGAAINRVPVWGAEELLGDIGRWRVAAAGSSPLAATGYTRSEVRFRELSEEEISAYVATGDPLDKAGSYGVQGLGSVLIEKIEGDFYSVMGLPLALLYQMLLPFGVSPLRQGIER